MLFEKEPMERDGIAVLFSEDAVDAEDVRRFLDHRDRRQGLMQIGYHWVVAQDGNTIAGRPEDEPGMHNKPRNKETIQICVVGSADTITNEQYLALSSLEMDLRDRYPNII